MLCTLVSPWDPTILSVSFEDVPECSSSPVLIVTVYFIFGLHLATQKVKNVTVYIAKSIRSSQNN